MRQINENINELGDLLINFGLWGTLLLIICGGAIYLAWHFLIKRIERMAEDASEKTLKKYQAEIDKDIYKFQTRHQKQIDAIHEVYQKLQALSGLLNFVVNGEPFTHPMKAGEQLKNLILCRHDFKNEYRRNRLLFGNKLRQSMDECIMATDKFIKEFEGGLMPESINSENEGEEVDGLFIVGIWKQGALQELVKKVDEISIALERDFSAVFGTVE